MIFDSPFFAVAFDYLNQPANGIHRAGAIALGAVSGYIIAIRRGFFRRFLYTSIGGLGVASICYPKDAEIYWHQAIHESKTYATILYNFAYGGEFFSFNTIDSLKLIFRFVTLQLNPATNQSRYQV